MRCVRRAGASVRRRVGLGFWWETRKQEVCPGGDDGIGGSRGARRQPETEQDSTDELEFYNHSPRSGLDHFVILPL